MFKKVLGMGVIGVTTLSNVVISAASYPVSPYGTIQLGLPRLDIDWESEKWADVFELKKQLPFTIGVGGLINPAYTNDWLFSVEINGQTLLQPQQQNQSWTSIFVEPMVFAMAKVTLPTSEHHDWFFGVGPFCVSWVNGKKCGNFLIELGANRHLNNGVYIRGSLRYVNPILGEAANDKPNILLANVGVQFNLS